MASIRDELRAMQGRLKVLARRFKDEKAGAGYLDIGAGSIAEALKGLSSATLRAPSDLMSDAPAAAPPQLAVHEPERGGGSAGEPSVRHPPQMAARAPAHRAPCSKCGSAEHDGRWHNGKREATTQPAARPAEPADEGEPEPAPPTGDVVHYYGAPDDGVPGFARCGAGGESVRIIARRKLVTCAPCLEVLERTDDVGVTSSHRCSLCGRQGHTRRRCPVPKGDKGVAELRTLRQAEEALAYANPIECVEPAAVEDVGEAAEAPAAEDEDPEPAELAPPVVEALDRLMTARAAPPAPAGPRPCRVCGELGHDGRRHRFDAARAARAILPLSGASARVEKEEECGPLPSLAAQVIAQDDAAASSEAPPLRRRQVICKRCHRPGHFAKSCDEDVVSARVQDVAAACVRLGLSPVPVPRARAPVVGLDVAPAVMSVWDRADPEQDLTDMFPDLVDEPPPPPPASGPALITPPPHIDLGADPRSSNERGRKTRLHRVEAERHMLHVLRADDERLAPEDDAARPRTRGDCENGPRPCPWSCRHNLTIDVNESTGSLIVNDRPQTYSCSLDAAEAGGLTLDEVGIIFGMSRERIRQIEVEGLAKIRKHSGDDLERPPERFDSPLGGAFES